VRLAWIDAPEKGQPFANVSRKSLGGLVAGKTVQVIERGVDRYGRTVGTVEVDGRDVNLEQLRRGLAWVYDRYIANARSDVQNGYRAAQEEARKEAAGLWQDKNPVPPWEFRRIGRAVAP
jgi:endonuclease YncB( thermonuclease family)